MKQSVITWNYDVDGDFIIYIENLLKDGLGIVIDNVVPREYVDFNHGMKLNSAYIIYKIIYTTKTN